MGDTKKYIYVYINVYVPKCNKWFDCFFIRNIITIGNWVLAYLSIISKLNLNQTGKINKIEGVSRKTSYQKLFDLNCNVKNKKGIPEKEWLVIEHIMLQSVLHHFAKKYFPSTYTYGFLIRSRTSTNSCSYFKQLKYSRNFIKSGIGVKIVNLIGRNDDFFLFCLCYEGKKEMLGLFNILFKKHLQ